MQRIRHIIRQLIPITEAELDALLEPCMVRNYPRNALLSGPGTVPDEVYFINTGLVRVVITDPEGTEHTVHFALEDQFIADYSGFILRQPALYALQALEPTEVVVLPRAAIEWGYQALTHGDRLGRLIAEYYFLYQDNRVRNLYARTPKERYDSITEIFPNIHNRVSQHLIASYLGISPVHLSRLKKAARSKP